MAGFFVRGRMVGMVIEYDSHRFIAPKILAILQDCGPLRAKDIAKEARRRNYTLIGDASGVNKVLTEYLTDSVVKIEGGRWVAKQPPPESLSPSAH